MNKIMNQCKGIFSAGFSIRLRSADQAILLGERPIVPRSRRFGPPASRNLLFMFMICVLSTAVNPGVSFSETTYDSSTIASSPEPVNVLWDGNFDSGDLSNWNWHPYPDYADPTVLWYVPKYGGPEQYGGIHPDYVGNGDLMWLTGDAATVAADPKYRTGPVLPGRKHSLGLLSKSTAGGSVEAFSTSKTVVGDWDPTSGNSTRRRTEIGNMVRFYGERLIPEGFTRWASVSLYIPADWGSGTNWGPVVWQWKPKINNGEMSPPISMAAEGGNWFFRVRQNTQLDPSGSGWKENYFHPEFQKSSPHYPDDAASVAALYNINKGGWTHFVMRVRFDGRSTTQGGEGFLDLWMRADDGPWIKVISFLPDSTYGVLFPMSEDNTWGFNTGMYMSNEQVLHLPAPGRTIYIDNAKVANDDNSFDAIFRQMSHDGSSPNSEALEEGMPPKPPVTNVE